MPTLLIYVSRDLQYSWCGIVNAGRYELLFRTLYPKACLRRSLVSVDGTYGWYLSID